MKNKSSQTNSQVPSEGTLEARILRALHAAYPEWTPASVLARISLQYNAKMLALRKRGWQIANRVEICNGKRHGYFRLATPGSLPNPAEKRVSTATNSERFNKAEHGSLFGDLSPDRSYRE
jgi:hypothetical protein